MSLGLISFVINVFAGSGSRSFPVPVPLAPGPTPSFTGVADPVKFSTDPDPTKGLKSMDLDMLKRNAHRTRTRSFIYRGSGSGPDIYLLNCCWSGSFKLWSSDPVPVPSHQWCGLTQSFTRVANPVKFSTDPDPTTALKTVDLNIRRKKNCGSGWTNILLRSKNNAM